jgi:hypothetical protein
MSEVLRACLRYGDEDAFLDSVTDLVQEVREFRAEQFEIFVDVRELPVLVDPKLLYEACEIIRAAVESLEGVKGLTLLCKAGCQETLARSSLTLIPFPWSVNVVTEYPLSAATCAEPRCPT